MGFIYLHVFRHNASIVPGKAPLMIIFNETKRPKLFDVLGNPKYGYGLLVPALEPGFASSLTWNLVEVRDDSGAVAVVSLRSFRLEASMNGKTFTLITLDSDPKSTGMALFE